MFDLNANPGDIGPPTARNLNFTPKSASIGLIQNLPGQLVASITAQDVERAPKPAELFSRGGHDATGTFDIGNLTTGSGLSTGSIEGEGNIFLAGRHLTVGSNGRATVFSGVIADQGVVVGSGGSLSKTGTGALTLSGANIYTGPTPLARRWRAN